MTEIQLQHVTYVYGRGTPFEKKALDDVCLTFAPGKITGLMGHTGSGKSTIAQLLNGLLRADAGTVLLNGEDIWKDPKQMRQIRFRVGLVFQYPEYQLFEETVRKDIAYGPNNMGLSAPEVEARVLRSAAFCGISPDILDKSPFELSGGQKRRVAIAGIMAMEPEVLVLDEPSAGLDPRGRREILGGIREYQKQTGKTMIIISHSMEDMTVYADRLAVLKDGKLVYHDDKEAVFSHGDELVKMGLSVPQISRVMCGLSDAGIAVARNIFDVPTALTCLLTLLREKQGADLHVNASEK